MKYILRMDLYLYAFDDAHAREMATNFLTDLYSLCDDNFRFSSVKLQRIRHNQPPVGIRMMEFDDARRVQDKED